MPEKARWGVPAVFLRERTTEKRVVEFLVAVPSFGVNLYPNLLEVNFSYMGNREFVREEDKWVGFGDLGGEVEAESVGELEK
jgi:hypothetical protein